MIRLTGPSSVARQNCQPQVLGHDMVVRHLALRHGMTVIP